MTKSRELGLEDSQMATAGRRPKRAAITIEAACIDIQRLQERGGTHGLPAPIMFSKPEIDTIESLGPALDGKTARRHNPRPSRSLARAGSVRARLDGWNCDCKPPGPVTMRRAAERCHPVHQGRLLGSRLV